MHNASRRRLGVQLTTIVLAVAAGAPAFARDDHRGVLPAGHGLHQHERDRRHGCSSSPAKPGAALLVLLPAHVSTQGQGTGSGSRLAGRGHAQRATDATSSWSMPGATGLDVRVRRAPASRSPRSLDSGGLHADQRDRGDGIVYVLNAGGDGNVAGSATPGRAAAAGGRNARRCRHRRNEPGAGRLRRGRRDAGRHREGDQPHHQLCGASQRDGWASPVVMASSGATPFGFAIRPPRPPLSSRRHSARPRQRGLLLLASTIAPRRRVASRQRSPCRTPQAAACWVAVSPNGRFAFTANAGTSTREQLPHLSARAEIRAGDRWPPDNGANAGATDMRSRPGRPAAVRARAAQRRRSHDRTAWTHDGTPRDSAGDRYRGFPPGSVGLAAN